MATRRGRHAWRPALGLATIAWALAARAEAPPSAAPPRPPAAEPATTPREAALEERLQKMEAMNERLLDQLQSLSKKYDDLSKRVDAPRGEGSSRPAPSTAADRGTGGAGAAAGGRGASDGSGPKLGSSTSDRIGASPSGTRPGSAADVDAGKPKKVDLKSFYDLERYGYVWQSDDGEYLLRVNGLIQADSRIYARQDRQNTLSDFNIPRARLYFSGRLTKPVEYQVSFQRSINANSFDLLNAYLNYRQDERLQVRFGRFKPPFTYEWYKVTSWELPTPERSLFALNFGPNRMVGLMGWGLLLDQRLEYAVGIFDGARNSYQDFNNSKDVMALIDYHPFFKEESSPLKNLGVGGSVDAGTENNPLTPAVLRTSTNASTATVTGTSGDSLISVPFLAFNNNVRERGSRGLWELHATYFYKGLSLLGAWDSGHNDFALTTVGARPVHLPVSGFFLQAAYLLTGETREKLGLIDPIRPFDLRRKSFGLGAFEVHSRYSELAVGRQVFAGGLADPNLWTNRAQLIDVGLDWYLNKNVKLYLDWEHAIFNQPVFTAPGRMATTNDLFWLRMNVYF